MMPSGSAPGGSVLTALGPNADETFDSVYPDWVTCHSARHWTPVEVARRAAELLAASAQARVLDVGSGAGKFCIVGALATDGWFCGVERRGHLVEVAREAAKHYGVQHRTRFVHADISAIDWREFNAFYLFNPFTESVGGLFGAIDQTIDLSPEIRARHVRFTKSQLTAAPVGTRVVTYHGFGAALPPGYLRVCHEPRGTDFVELWVKQPRVARLPSRDSSVEAGAGGASVTSRPAARGWMELVGADGRARATGGGRAAAID
jgi:hypothetical protein